MEKQKLNTGFVPVPSTVKVFGEMEPNKVKKILVKSLTLDKCLRAYHAYRSEEKEAKRKEIFDHFEKVWGTTLANDYLSEYDDAKSMIAALDEDNLNLFINRFYE